MRRHYRRGSDRGVLYLQFVLWYDRENKFNYCKTIQVQSSNKCIRLNRLYILYMCCTWKRPEHNSTHILPAVTYYYIRRAVYQYL